MSTPFASDLLIRTSFILSQSCLCVNYVVCWSEIEGRYPALTNKLTRF